MTSITMNCKCCGIKKDGNKCTNNASVMIAYQPYCGIHSKTQIKKEERDTILSIKEKKITKQKKINNKKEEPVLINCVEEIKDLMKSSNLYGEQLLKEMKKEVTKKFGITKKNPDFKNKLREILKEYDCEDIL